ncbi:MAG: hypothetical protein IAE78_30560 [Myxococcus sp.]|nr:hypothetical protein [Myxococcus sp.]
MLIAFAASLLVSTSSGTRPNTYSERWLCDLWAGAQCHATSCQKDGKQRCEAVSKQCQETSKRVEVESGRAQKKAACARALLGQACGAPKPPECDGLL